MQKVTVNELVDFSRGSDRSKKSLAHRLKTRIPKEKKELEKDDSGGNYWMPSTSCIINVFKQEDKELYNLKIEALHTKLKSDIIPRTKVMRQKNIDILSNFRDFELSDLKPPHIMKYEKVQKQFTIIKVNGFPLYINPSIVFSFSENDKLKIGAIWFIPKKNGFHRNEIGMFCEMLQRFLVENYADDFQISQDYCSVVDTFKAQKVVYTELSEGIIPSLINKTLNEINEL